MTSEILLKQIRQERRRQRISLRDMGRKLGVSGQYISMIERGLAPLKIDDYFKICQFLQISPSLMLVEEEQRKERKTLAEKVDALSERDFQIIMNVIEMMQ